VCALVSVNVDHHNSALLQRPGCLHSSVAPVGLDDVQLVDCKQTLVAEIGSAGQAVFGRLNRGIELVEAIALPQNKYVEVLHAQGEGDEAEGADVVGAQDQPFPKAEKVTHPCHGHIVYLDEGQGGEVRRELMDQLRQAGKECKRLPATKQE